MEILLVVLLLIQENLIGVLVDFLSIQKKVLIINHYGINGALVEESVRS